MAAMMIEQNPQIRAVMRSMESDPDASLSKAEELLNTARGQSDKALEAKAQQIMSAVHLQRWETKAALASAEQAVKAFEDLQDNDGQISALRLIVEARLADGDSTAAMKVATDATEKFRSSKNARGEAAMLLLQAEVQMNMESYDDASAKASQTMDMITKLDAKERTVTAGKVMLKLSEFLGSIWKVPEALQAAEEAAKIFGELQGPEARACKGAALNSLATAQVASENYAAALTQIDAAREVFKGIGDTNSECAVLRTKMNTHLAAKKPSQARDAANEAVALCRAAKDTQAEADSLLVVAEICAQSMHSKEAVEASTEALGLYKSLNSRAGQSAALAAMASADAENESGKSVWAATERVTLFKDAGDIHGEGEAQLALAKLYVGRIAKKITRCQLASSDDSVAALFAAREAAHQLARSGDHEGRAAAQECVGQVLMYNGVDADVIASATDPDQVYNDVMSGVYTSSKNALPGKVHQPANQKLEDMVPSAGQLQRGSFSWSNPLKGFTYVLDWQPMSQRKSRGKRPRGRYDVLALSSSVGNRTSTIPATLQARANDACDRAEPLVVYMVGNDAHMNYASCMMSAVNTMACMITAQLKRLVFVQTDESFFDWKTDTMAQNCNMHPVILGLLRSLRLEAPNIQVGFVGGDALTWLSKPEPMIESIFDTLECDETEVFYKRGEAYAPLLSAKTLDEPTTLFVKPKKGNSTWSANNNIK